MRVLAEQGISQGGVQTVPHVFKNCEYTLCNPKLLKLKKKCLCQVQFSRMLKAYVLFSLDKLSGQFYFFLIAHIHFLLLGFHSQVLCGKYYRGVFFII